MAHANARTLRLVHGAAKATPSGAARHSAFAAVRDTSIATATDAGDRLHGRVQLLRRGRRNTAMTLCEQAIERAKELIRNGGINVGDFKFECHDIASGGPGDMIITYDVVVTKQSTQKHRTY